MNIDEGSKGNGSKDRKSASAGDPTDGRKPYDWRSKYPKPAIIEISLETAYLFVLFAIAYFLILATWQGWLHSWLSIPPEQVHTFQRYSYYFLSGMLGGVAFDMKYLYRTVARGLWHQDRRIWRALSPFVAMTVAFTIGAMIDSSLMSTGVKASGAGCVSIGFLSGYFADSAVGKMSEVALVLFGKSAVVKDSDAK